jgi:hypothetical protein
MNLNNFNIIGYNFTTRELTIIPDLGNPSIDALHQKKVKIEDIVNDTNSSSEEVGESCIKINEFMKTNIKSRSNKLEDVSVKRRDNSVLLHCDMIDESDNSYFIEKEISINDIIKLILGIY